MTSVSYLRLITSRKEPIPVKPTNLVKTDSVTSSVINSTLANSQVGLTPLEPPPIDHGETTAVRAARAARSGMGKRLRVTADMETEIASRKSEVKNAKVTKRAARREDLFLPLNVWSLCQMKPRIFPCLTAMGES